MALSSVLAVNDLQKSGYPDPLFLIRESLS